MEDEKLLSLRADLSSVLDFIASPARALGFPRDVCSGMNPRKRRHTTSHLSLAPEATEQKILVEVGDRLRASTCAPAHHAGLSFHGPRSSDHLSAVIAQPSALQLAAHSR